MSKARAAVAFAVLGVCTAVGGGVAAGAQHGGAERSSVVVADDRWPLDVASRVVKPLDDDRWPLDVATGVLKRTDDRWPTV
ncbi:hypothetical protein ABT095_27250 [Kitasatospora sp. NPDC002227]|uniref:hypothetical protein n=1 Tax=Kitasatospora sp. NPDC002227 TaxID=3154773 RepID=UPI00332789DB